MYATSLSHYLGSLIKYLKHWLAELRLVLAGYLIPFSDHIGGNARRH